MTMQSGSSREARLRAPGGPHTKDGLRIRIAQDRLPPRFVASTMQDAIAGSQMAPDGVLDIRRHVCLPSRLSCWRRRSRPASACSLIRAIASARRELSSQTGFRNVRLQVTMPPPLLSFLAISAGLTPAGWGGRSRQPVAGRSAHDPCSDLLLRAALPLFANVRCA
jgi:hypothetical protein